MAYDQARPHQTMRRPFPAQQQQQQHQVYDDEPEVDLSGLYDGGPYALSSTAARGKRAPAKSASQPHNLHGQYEMDGRPGGAGGAMRSQSQQQRRPPPDARRNGPGPGPGPGYGYGVDEGMRSMHIGANGQSRGPQGPPRGGGQFRGGDPRMDRGGGGMGMRQGGQMRAPHGSYDSGRGGPPMGYDSGRGGPPMGYDMGRSGHPQQQRLPPRGGRGFANGGSGDHPPSGRPPPIQGAPNGYGQIHPADDSGYRLYPGEYQSAPEPTMGVQRSQTMPTISAQPQYQAYNPAAHAPAVVPKAEVRQNPAYGVRGPPESQWPRESVADVLDAYFQEADYYDDYVDDYADAYTYQNAPAGHAAQSNFPQAAPPGTAHPQANGQWNGGDSDFAQQAYRSRSQPDLAGQYSAGAHYDGPAEMPADLPPIPRPSIDGYSIPPRSNVPAALRMGSPAPRSIRSNHSIRSVQSSALPQRRPSVQQDGGLPAHPSPAELREAEQVAMRHSNPDLLPAHPPPVRPGLLQDAAGGPTHTPPPPIRQYEDDRRTDRPSPTSAEAPVTMQELEQMRNQATMNPNDNTLQLKLAKKMVEAATTLASEGGRADIKTTRRNRENYIFDAHKIIKKLTNASFPDAMFYLASCYGEGQLGLQVDHERAFNLYQSAAKLNHAPSAYRTAVCCELGAGVRKDPTRAMTWYKKAAALGETPAMFKLGMIMWKGLLGQTRNPRDGLIWLKRAADQADEANQHALHELGMLYEGENGDVVIPDVDYARELFLRAAELGYAASQFRMGCGYEYGTLGCPVDPRKSIAWYSKAAMKGDHEAQLALSGWYLTGSEGVIQQSDTEAYLWARKAAEHGLAKAEYALGYYTEVGIGVPPNLDEAKKWYYKAASQQHPKAQLRLQELKKGGTAAVQKSRERLSRSNGKHKEEGDCVVM
ncbi:hypothetical protein BZA05DRAFT_140758 [Tricharina praecox]|uniref:uncharacterized protein n=1 Tax=Tricharina praecox TaxID=43433 RepID=UPI00221E68F0|nr:uncharacterized protein BZA05DRAFT_140758 [Tricharina praecox]KAI5846178.1 hypothetical protein BZA05DRAFT_140758 [Tricharina praecox]